MMYLLISGISHLVNTYLSYRYFEYFFGGEKYNPIVTFVSFALYFLFDAYIYSHHGGIAFMLIGNVLLFYLLTQNYRGKQRKKMFAALFYGLIFSALELGVLFFVLHFPLDLWEEAEYSYILGHVLSTILLFVFIAIVENRKDYHKPVSLPAYRWLILLLTPIVSFCFLLFLIFFTTLTLWQLSLCCLFLLPINVVVFYFYDKIVAHFSAVAENDMLIRQNMYYDHVVASIKLANNSERALFHDLKNHIISMDSLLSAKEYDKLECYFHHTFPDMIAKNISVSTGNAALDSLIHYKQRECKALGIDMRSTVVVPEEMPISDYYITVILGNLLDNAIEAVKKMDQNKVIQLMLRYKCECFVLVVKNPYKGTLRKQNQMYLTDKTDRSHHGYGLRNVQNMVEQNGGAMEISDAGQVFEVTVVLYADEHLMK